MAVQAVAPVVPFVFWPLGHEKHEEAPELGAYVLTEHAAQVEEPDQPQMPVEGERTSEMVVPAEPAAQGKAYEVALAASTGLTALAKVGSSGCERLRTSPADSELL
jgi:hypothetical protein